MSVGQYLQHYAEAETHQFSGVDQYYENILAIPVFNEANEFITRLQTLYTKQSLLIILMVNAPDHLSQDDTAITNTQTFVKSLKRHCTAMKEYSPTMNLLALSDTPRRHIVLIERCSEGHYIPAKEGVGLARKIACDIACKIIASGRINSPWIHTTDADATLPEGYFEVSQSLDTTQEAVALYPFKHQANPDPRLNLCQKLYDISLDYYVEALTWAKSPYAYHTVGSTLLINFHAYALVRGFPKRAAGEDFYLLNKLAKISDIVSLSKPVISLETRLSDRVPFGTGPALIKLSALSKPVQEYTYYNPLCFVYLKLFLSLFHSLWESKTSTLSLQVLEELVTKPEVNLKLLQQSLDKIQINEALKHAHKNSKSEEAFLRHMNNWFDGFRTLKFIHFMRDILKEALNKKQHSSITAPELLVQANFLSSELKERLTHLG